MIEKRKKIRSVTQTIKNNKSPLMSTFYQIILLELLTSMYVDRKWYLRFFTYCCLQKSLEKHRTFLSRICFELIKKQTS